MHTRKDSESQNVTVTFPRTQTERNKVRKKAEVGDKIRAFRMARKLSQPQLAESLGITKNSISNWESGISRPEFSMIPKLCRVLCISSDEFFGLPNRGDTLTDVERKHMKAYRELNRFQQRTVDTMINAMLENDMLAFREECESAFSRKDRRPLPASAGTGMPLTDVYEADYVFLRNSRNVCRADTIITVSGDSMNPTFADGDDLLVEYTESIDVGQIGIFIVAGEGFVKEYQPDGLHSHNPKYKTIHPTEDDNFRCVGRVLDVVTPDMLATPRELAVLNEIYSTEHKK